MKKVSHYIGNGLEKFTRTFFSPKFDRKTYDLAVIGGGINGVSIARKAAMRGLKVVLIEKDEIGSGTSGHFHELLHSGARYAVHDPVSAKECFEENQLLCSSESLVKNAIEQTGGLFLAINDSDIAFSEELIAACHKLGIPISEIDVNKVILQEPNINKSIKRALLVPDGYIDGKKVMQINKNIAIESGANLLTHHKVIAIKIIGNQIESLVVRNKDGKIHIISCGFVINAAGPWAGQVCKLAGIEIPLVPYKGALIVFKERLCRRVLNRCHTPSDGDIFVPAGSHTIFGTTSKKTDDIDNFAVTKNEIDILLHEGGKLIPEISQNTIIAMHAGFRPLYSPTHGDTNGRDATRSFAIINHKNTNKINNFISVIGGKFTIYERMSSQALEVMSQNLQNPFSNPENAYIQVENKNAEITL